jgi:Protein of unknown function (DUF3631)
MPEAHGMKLIPNEPTLDDAPLVVPDEMVLEQNEAEMAEQAPVTAEATEALLDSVYRYLARFLILTPAQKIALTLWVAHTHAFDAARCTPYLNIYSAQFSSGKTRVMEVLSGLARRPRFTASVSRAALVRIIGVKRETMFIDEWDQMTKADKAKVADLLVILNAGYLEGGTATVNIPDGKNGWKPTDLSVFSPKAIAGVGDQLPETTVSRCIPIQMQRKLTDEKVEGYSVVKRPSDCDPLKAKLEAWGEAAVPSLTDAEPSPVAELMDRTQDIWEPLLSIADVAGERWGKAARDAAVQLHTKDGRSTEEMSLDNKLLADIRTIFERYDNPEGISTLDLVGALCTLEESPWGEWWWDSYLKKYSPKAPRQMNKWLGRYGIKSRNLPRSVSPEDRLRGYVRADFEDAWSRYLDGNEAVQSRDDGDTV